MRAFFGLAIPDALWSPLVAARDRISAGRAVPDDNLHLTLAFLEEVDTGLLHEVDLILGGARLVAPPLRLLGLQTFGSPPRVLAAEIAEDPALTRLHAQVRGALRSAGLDLPRSRFRPHVTLRRLGPTDALGRLSPVLPPAVARADRLCLWESRLRPDGARYDLLADYPLAPS